MGKGWWTNVAACSSSSCRHRTADLESRHESIEGEGMLGLGPSLRPRPALVGAAAGAARDQQIGVVASPWNLHVCNSVQGAAGKGGAQQRPKKLKRESGGASEESTAAVDHHAAAKNLRDFCWRIDYCCCPPAAVE